MFGKVSILSALVSAASAGTIVWDGRFNDMTSSADIAKWSFATPVGSYQCYIHGAGSIDKYVNLDSKFKNPADEGSKQGAKITIDETSKWNGQTMLRTELIPQTSATINKGKLFYHFSIKTGADNAPLAANEHQIAFFESHFTELKYGGDAKNKLQWCVSGQPKWDVELKADEWHNVAYEIDFDGGAVTFWYSTGSDALAKTAGPFTTTTSSDGKDFHVGVLRLPGSNDAPGAEDWFFSGVYIESGEINTSVNSAGGAAGAAPAPASPAKPSSSAASSTLVTVVKPSAAASSSVVAQATPVVTPTPSPAAPVVTPSASPAAPAETPAAPQPGSGSGSDAKLPKEFTIKQFVAWLRAKQAQGN
ncbi:hypothetical protein HBI96_099580 [Parastagonospora nodorum]|nr:hypothetical protein HBI96_099580 [Parastagonospora nodorum]